MSEAADSCGSTSEPKGQPVRRLKQSTLLEQSSVNRAILESLERLNQNILPPLVNINIQRMIIHMNKSMKSEKGVMTPLRWTFIKKSMLL